MVSQEEEGKAAERKAVLTAPLALEGGLLAEYRPPNMLRQVFGLFRGLQPGSDLANFQLPCLFNMPKSQLQCYGESVYCVGEDHLKRCARGRSSLERFISVVAWCISTARPVIFGLAPYNPILGETHHVSRGSLNVFLEQVSHHPPITALHATDAENNVELVWCQHPAPKFYGTSVEAVIHGKRQLKLLEFGESYEMNSPNMLIKILPVPGAHWAGNVSIRCEESGLAADVCFYKSRNFLGFRGDSRAVKGKIFYAKTMKTVYELEGQWDRTVELKDPRSGETRVLFDAKESISKLSTPTVKDPKGLRRTESAVVWSELSEGILGGDWEKARDAKRGVEERERKMRKEREARGEEWAPRHFRLAKTKGGAWECWPLEHSVSAAPITVSP